MDKDFVLLELDRFGISTTSHTGDNLCSHLKGTYEILRRWHCSDEVCLAGLCHSIYGTESFVKQLASLENRTYLRGLIGDEAENLTYLFGVHRKDSLWSNLEKTECFQITNRFDRSNVTIAEQELSQLITLTLANWLEQRPRSAPEDRFLRQNEFLKSERHLPTKAYAEFLEAYGLQPQNLSVGPSDNVRILEN